MTPKHNTLLAIVLVIAAMDARADGPAYELVWTSGNALFRWRDGAPELVLRTKAPIDTVCAAKGGWIGYTSGGSGFVLAKGATAPVKLVGAVRKGKATVSRTCAFEGAHLKVEVATPDYDYDQVLGEGSLYEIALALGRGISAAALLPKEPVESTSASPSGRFSFLSAKRKKKFGEFRVLFRQPAAGGRGLLVFDEWDQNQSMCSDAWASDEGCDCAVAIEMKGWLPGDALFVKVMGGCPSGDPEDRVVPSNSDTVLVGELSGSPDGQHWRIGAALCGPDGTCRDLPSQATDAVWTER